LPTEKTHVAVKGKTSIREFGVLQALQERFQSGFPFLGRVVVAIRDFAPNSFHELGSDLGS